MEILELYWHEDRMKTNFVWVKSQTSHSVIFTCTFDHGCRLQYSEYIGMGTPFYHVSILYVTEKCNHQQGL